GGAGFGRNRGAWARAEGGRRDFIGFFGSCAAFRPIGRRTPLGPRVRFFCYTARTRAPPIVRSKLMLLAVTLALAAYVPACCCWMETVSAWMVGGGDGAVSHRCCGHSGARDHGHHGDGESDSHDSGAPCQGPATPGHATECG